MSTNAMFNGKVWTWDTEKIDKNRFVHLLDQGSGTYGSRAIYGSFQDFIWLSQFSNADWKSLSKRLSQFSNADWKSLSKSKILRDNLRCTMQHLLITCLWCPFLNLCGVITPDEKRVRTEVSHTGREARAASKEVLNTGRASLWPAIL